jgi:hypothetical protein
MLELKDFDCEETFELYVELVDKWKDSDISIDKPSRWWNDKEKRWYFQVHNGIIYRYMTIERRLLEVEILLKRVLDAK